MSEFEKWFIASFPYLKEYFENTSFDGARFLPKDAWHPEHCNSASSLNIALKAWGDQQAIIDDLQAQLNNMERCYIQLKQEHNELIAFNTAQDRKQKAAEKVAEKYKRKVLMIADLLRDSTDKDMTLKAIQTVIERVGEHV